VGVFGSTVTEVFLNLTEVFLTLTEGFSCFFLSCKANARVKLAKTGHGPHSSTLVCICVFRLLLFVFFGCYYLCCSVVICVVLCIVLCRCVLPPGDNPIAVYKYIISYHICSVILTISSALKTSLLLETVGML